MVRPKKRRFVGREPEVLYFKPRAVPLKDLEEITLKVEELESIRLRNKEGLNQEEAAEKMNVSRSTFSRILKDAEGKIADFLIDGNALRIEGGEYIINPRSFVCENCGNEWSVSHGEARPKRCPECGGVKIKSTHEIKSRGD